MSSIEERAYLPMVFFIATRAGRHTEEKGQREESLVSTLLFVS